METELLRRELAETESELKFTKQRRASFIQLRATLPVQYRFSLSGPFRPRHARVPPRYRRTTKPDERRIQLYNPRY